MVEVGGIKDLPAPLWLTWIQNSAFWEDIRATKRDLGLATKETLSLKRRARAKVAIVDDENPCEQWVLVVLLVTQFSRPNAKL